MARASSSASLASASASVVDVSGEAAEGAGHGDVVPPRLPPARAERERLAARQLDPVEQLGAIGQDVELERRARLPAVRGEARERAHQLLAFTGLAGKDDQPSGSLTLADKKRLEITRALATQPRLLLLDEAMSGLTPRETAQAVELVRRIHTELKLTLCVVEHVMEVVMPLSHRVVVLNYGEKLVEGTPQDVVRNELVIKAYLGEQRGG